MNFDFSEDQKFLRKTAREFLTEHAPLSLCRAVLESDASYSDTLWKGVADLGWLATAIPEEYGGAGFGRLELAVLAEELGRSLAPIPFASTAYLASEALMETGTPEQKQAYLPKIATGEWIGAFAHAERVGQGAARTASATFAKRAVTGTKIAVADGDVAHFAVVSVVAGGDLGLALVDLSDKGVTRTPVKSVDPSRSLATLRFDGAQAQLLGGKACGAAVIQKVLDRAAVYLAFEQVGGAQQAFELTREYTLGRYAFGRPIASFQALKHRMADVYVEIELARSNAYYGAWALDADAPELGIAASGARSIATDAFELATKEMVQLHGGVGFTWEYDCHMFYRRATYLAAMIGGASEWREYLIQRLEAARTAA